MDIKNIAKTILLLAVAAAAGSCIKNDIPVQTARCVILEFEAEGQNSVSINPQARTVVIDLHEDTDPAAVTVSKVVVGDNAQCSVGEGSLLDLTQPKTVTVSAVESYPWTISATQTIERRLRVESQEGPSYIEGDKYIIAYVPKNADLSKVNILELKLGPASAVYTPELKGVTSFEGPDGPNGQPKTFSVNVKYRNVDETWTVAVERIEPKVRKAEGFTQVAWLEGIAESGNENGFEYRLASGGDGDWAKVPAENIKEKDGVFEGWLRGLQPETEYAVRAFSGEERGSLRRFTTGKVRQLPDAGFEQWHSTPVGRYPIWNPWPKGGEQWWDTGNMGATTLGPSNSIPSAAGEGCPDNSEGIAAYLETRFVGIGTVGRPAGGNIYFGKYYETNGIDGSCDIGHPWDTKPTRLKGWYKYFPKKITHVGPLHRSESDRWMGTTDSLNICIALWSKQPGDPYPDATGFVVNTATTSFRDFSREEPGVIAYGKFATPNEQADWDEFSIEIEYFDKGPLPANTVMYLMITASKNCNYFTAADGSLLYVDELSLEYD